MEVEEGGGGGGGGGGVGEGGEDEKREETEGWRQRSAMSHSMAGRYPVQKKKGLGLFVLLWCYVCITLRFFSF